MRHQQQPDERGHAGNRRDLGDGFLESTVTVPHAVSRIACVTSTCVGMVRELGLEPVAIDGDSGKAIASNPRVFGPDRTETFSVIRGSFSAPNIEDIIAAKPELAIGNVRTHSKVRDAIASVAPMYLIATAAYPDTFRQLLDLGKLTGREARAAAAVQRFKDKLAATNAKSPGNLVALLVYGEFLPSSQHVTSGIQTPGDQPEPRARS